MERRLSWLSERTRESLWESHSREMRFEPAVPSAPIVPSRSAHPMVKLFHLRLGIARLHQAPYQIVSHDRIGRAVPSP